MSNKKCLRATFAMHPTVQRLSDPAFRLAVGAVCWSELWNTGGFIPTDAVESLCREIPSDRRPGEIAKELVETAAYDLPEQFALWRRCEGGYWIASDAFGIRPARASGGPTPSGVELRRVRRGSADSDSEQTGGTTRRVADHRRRSASKRAQTAEQSAPNTERSTDAPDKSDLSQSESAVAEDASLQRSKRSLANAENSRRRWAKAEAGKLEAGPAVNGATGAAAAEDLNAKPAMDTPVDANGVENSDAKRSHESRASASHELDAKRSHEADANSHPNEANQAPAPNAKVAEIPLNHANSTPAVSVACELDANSDPNDANSHPNDANYAPVPNAKVAEIPPNHANGAGEAQGVSSDANGGVRMPRAISSSSSEILSKEIEEEAKDLTGSARGDAKPDIAAPNANAVNAKAGVEPTASPNRSSAVDEHRGGKPVVSHPEAAVGGYGGSTARPTTGSQVRSGAARNEVVVTNRETRQPGTPPIVQPTKEPIRVLARNLVLPPDFKAYANELGLTDQQYARAESDWRAKANPSPVDHVCDLLNRYIEQSAKKQREQQGIGRGAPEQIPPPRPAQPPAERSFDRPRPPQGHYRPAPRGAAAQALATVMSNLNMTDRGRTHTP